MKLLILGPVGDGGYGTTTEELSLALLKQGIDLYIFPTSLPRDTQLIHPAIVKKFVDGHVANNLIQDSSVTVVHHTYPGGYGLGERGIILTTHETEIMPTNWLAQMNSAKAIILNTQWLYDAMQTKNTVTRPMFILPHGISLLSDPEFHEPPADKFRFFVLDKAADVCIQGFIKAFGDDPSVELIVKIRKHTCYFDPNQHMTSNVKILSQDFMPAYKIESLNYTSHCFLHPVEGAGWSLPIAESLARGIPVIANRKNGITEYTRPGDLLEPGYEERPFKFEPWVPDGLANTEWGVKYYPTVDGIAKACLEMKENYPDWKAKAMDCSKYLKANFTWEQAAQKFIKILGQI